MNNIESDLQIMSWDISEMKALLRRAKAAKTEATRERLVSQIRSIAQGVQSRAQTL